MGDLLKRFGRRFSTASVGAHVELQGAKVPKTTILRVSVYRVMQDFYHQLYSTSTHTIVYYTRMAQYPKLESVGSIASMILGTLEVQVCQFGYRGS